MTSQDVGVENPDLASWKPSSGGDDDPQAEYKPPSEVEMSDGEIAAGGITLSPGRRSPRIAAKRASRT